jgi:hypothetical protein
MKSAQPSQKLDNTTMVPTSQVHEEEEETPNRYPKQPLATQTTVGAVKFLKIRIGIRTRL